MRASIFVRSMSRQGNSMMDSARASGGLLRARRCVAVAPAIAPPAQGRLKPRRGNRRTKKDHPMLKTRPRPMNDSYPTPPAKCYASVPSAAAADEAMQDLASLSHRANPQRGLQARAAPHRAARGLRARGRRLGCAHQESGAAHRDDISTLMRKYTVLLASIHL